VLSLTLLRRTTSLHSNTLYPLFFLLSSPDKRPNGHHRPPLLCATGLPCFCCQTPCSACRRVPPLIGMLLLAFPASRVAAACPPFLLMLMRGDRLLLLRRFLYAREPPPSSALRAPPPGLPRSAVPIFYAARSEGMSRAPSDGLPLRAPAAAFGMRDRANRSDEGMGIALSCVWRLRA
jgi:hypothetical protein